MEVCGKTLENLASNCTEFLIHAVDVEGKCSGIDTKLVELLAEYSPCKCVYAGGISSFDDIQLIADAGNGRIDFTIGSALDIFGGHIAYKDVVNYCK
jgi:phosphoribosylformimino-5-aminoimidazole carboxamide ribotide isomerase